MMNKEEFAKYLADKFNEEGYDAIVKPVNKNGVELTGVSIGENSEARIRPTMYIDEYYEKYLEETKWGALPDTDALDKLFGSALVQYQMEFSNRYVEPKEEDVKKIYDWDSAKDNIIPVLINTDANQSILDNAPHREVNDLSVAYRVVVSDYEFGYASALVSNDLLNMYGVSAEELDSVARENVKNNVKIDPLIDVLIESGTVKEEDIQMLPLMPNQIVVSNQNKIDGAYHITDQDVMDKICKWFGTTSVVVLPSSKHECICMDEADVYDINEIAELVKEINQTVSPNDLLSYNIYKYNSLTKELTQATNVPERVNVKTTNAIQNVFNAGKSI